jgi:signal transduction histidine kinase
MREIPFWNRLSTRLGLLVIVIVLVLAGATAILLVRGFGRISVDTAQALESVGVEPTADLSAIVRSTVINLLAVFLLTMVGATLFSRSFLVDPIAKLMEATHRVARGELGVTLPETPTGELGQLAASFNEMSLGLKRRTEELLKANEALRQSEAMLEQRVAERTSELVSLLDLSNNIALTVDDTPLLEYILDKLSELAPYRGAAVYKLLGGRRLEPVLARGKLSPASEEELLARLGPDGGGRPVIGGAQHVFPLIVRERTVGLLVLERPTGRPLPAERLQLIEAFAHQAGVAIENTNLYQQVQEQAATFERQHLARELHDSVSQALYSIVLGAHAAQRQLHDPAKAEQALHYVQNLAEAGLAEMRALIFELRPEVLEQEGLKAALRKQAEALEVRHKIRSDFEATGEPDLPFPAKQALYRISQEALHNIVKHARAARVTVRLAAEADRVCLEISDDGVGFDPHGEYPGHLGLRSMRERAAALGGVLRLSSAPQAGTHLVVEVPYG